jgi:hypothetical protein
MRQLSLFSPQELMQCYEATNVISIVRKSLRASKQKKPVSTTGQVIKFPIKKVS